MWILLGRKMRQIRESHSTFPPVNSGELCCTDMLTFINSHRDGDDGPWSTFRVGVGNPTQQMRLLPGAGQSTSTFVFPEACARMTLRNGENCDDKRGGLYMRNESQTWEQYGNYELNTYLEMNVGLAGAGLYGYDTLDLGWTGDGAPSLKNQSIVGVVTPNFTLGLLALSARPVNFTNYNNPIPSLLQNLRNSSSPIPSLSWSYTAGAFNRAPKIFGSLVLGGYDSARFKPNNLTFPFGADVSSDLQVQILSITTNDGGRNLLSSTIVSYISTLIPDIWLPQSACDEFMRIFGLNYSNTTGSYLISEDSHKANLASNPVVTFSIGPTASGPSTTIEMPYWNFYLAIKPQPSGTPTDSGAFRFPLMRATSESQYILGRAFLQSAYLTKDYERKSFKLSQALYPSGFEAEKIVSILPPGQPNDLTPQNPDSPKSGLGTGVIAGIAVGAVIILAVVVGVVYLFRRRKQKKEKGQELEDTEVTASARHEMDGNQSNYELQDGSGLKHEMMGDMDPKVELSACREQEKPAEVADTPLEIYELPATERRRPVEMEGEGHVKEMPP